MACRASRSVLLQLRPDESLYALFGAAGLYVHGFQRMFYVVQVLAAGGVATYVVRNKQYWRGAEFRSAWRAIDWTLVLIIALSVFTTHRYKAAFDVLPDGSRRLIVNGDATYLSSLAYELGRQTPAAQQSVRAGIKERAYHMYPHLTAMLVARYTGQPDILDSMSRYQFLVIEVLLCLILFATVRAATGSRAAGYLAVAMTYILAIPLPPLNALVANYWYFTWHPHATSTLEPSILNSPQTYGALPVVMGALLCLMQLSLQVSRSRAGGNVAVIAGLMAAVLIRFRVQTFLIFFPGLMLLFVVLAWRQRQWRYLGAACLAVLAVGVQLVEMKLPAYYPQSASLLIHNNHLEPRLRSVQQLARRRLVRAGLAYLLYPPVFDWTWQVLCLAVFTVLHMAGPPVAFFCGLHWFNRSTWRAPTWIFSGMIAWLTCVTIMGATCLSTPYDYWSVGGQSLFMIGWYLLPLFVIGLWQARTLLPRWTAIASPYVPAVAAMLLVSACVWQRARNHTDVQQSLHYGPVIPAPEWEAMRFIRTKLPQDAVLLTKASHHSAGACMLSGIAGRAAFMEYFCIGGPLGGGPHRTVAGPRGPGESRLESRRHARVCPLGPRHGRHAPGGIRHRAARRPSERTPGAALVQSRRRSPRLAAQRPGRTTRIGPTGPQPVGPVGRAVSGQVKKCGMLSAECGTRGHSTLYFRIPRSTFRICPVFASTREPGRRFARLSSIRPTAFALAESLYGQPATTIIRGLIFERLSPETAMRHVLSAVVQNVPGVLAHISGMLASRGYNIDSLAVGETEEPGLSRMTFVIMGDDSVLEQVRKQLEKIVTVVKVADISSQDYVERDLMLIKVKSQTGAERSEIKELADVFRGRIVDVAADEVVVEISGPERKIEAFIDLMRPHGILEMVRTGRIAMVRGPRSVPAS